MKIAIKNKKKMIFSIIIILIVIIGIPLLPKALSREATFGIGDYFFKVPLDWQVQGNKSEITFKKNNYNIGGIQIINYYPGEPLSIPNHSQIVGIRDVSGLVTKATLINMNLTQPAASGNTSVKNENHLYLIFEKEKVAYDIYADSKALNEAQLINIGKSFEHKK